MRIVCWFLQECFKRKSVDKTTGDATTLLVSQQCHSEDTSICIQLQSRSAILLSAGLDCLKERASILIIWSICAHWTPNDWLLWAKLNYNSLRLISSQSLSEPWTWVPAYAWSLEWFTSLVFAVGQESSRQSSCSRSSMGPQRRTRGRSTWDYLWTQRSHRRHWTA